MQDEKKIILTRETFKAYMVLKQIAPEMNLGASNLLFEEPMFEKN